MKRPTTFWEIIERYRPAIVAECRRACGPRSDLAEDLAGEAILLLHNRQRQVTCVPDPEPYIRLCTRYLAWRRLKRERRREMLPLELAV